MTYLIRRIQLRKLITDRVSSADDALLLEFARLVLQSSVSKHEGEEGVFHIDEPSEFFSHDDIAHYKLEDASAVQTEGSDEQ